MYNINGLCFLRNLIMMSYYGYSQGGRGFLSSLPKATKHILAINILLFVATLINEQFMVEKFAMFYPTSPFFKPWQVVTHMFMHGGFWHLFFNMYSLLMFGTILERSFGTKRFLIFYFVTGLGAALLHTGVEYLQAQSYVSAGAFNAYHSLLCTPTLGASGAIYGILLGFGMLYPNEVLMLMFPPIPLKAKWFVLIFAGIELVTGILGTSDGVAQFAHLGGMLFGFLLITYWRKRNRYF